MVYVRRHGSERTGKFSGYVAGLLCGFVQRREHNFHIGAVGLCLTGTLFEFFRQGAGSLRCGAVAVGILHQRRCRAVYFLCQRVQFRRVCKLWRYSGGAVTQGGRIGVQLFKGAAEPRMQLIQPRGNETAARESQYAVHGYKRACVRLYGQDEP
jgi:hypothetical protein